jgi:hypothetical protein
MKLELKHQDTYGETFFYMIYRISFLHIYHIEKFAVQVFISLSLFIIVNGNTKQTSECSYENKNTKRTDLSMSIACAMIAVKDKQQQRHCVLMHLTKHCLCASPCAM